MEISHANDSQSFHGAESPKTSVTTDNLVDFCSELARRYPVKVVQKHTGLSKKQVENIRQGISGVSGKTLTNWCINNPEVAAEYAEFIGFIRPGEAKFAGALTRFANAVAQREGRA